MKQDLKSMTLEEMQAAFKALGEPAFRAKQVFVWLHRGAASFDEMTNLSKPLRQKLDELYDITAPQIVRKLRSQKDGTIKYLWKLRDGNCVESVLMQYHHGNSICISSEVGCPMGCKFCASTLGGLVRRLTASELLDQVLFAQLDSGMEISNIVLMGIGEPLDNFDNVMRFLELVNSPDGMNIGMRHISLSTCGLVDKIRLLAEKKLQITLSVSLHSPDNESRNKIMPINRRWNVETLLAACKDYYETTGRRVSFEYTMIDGVSDAPEQAELLAKKLQGMAAHVNMIPLNSVEESGLRCSSRQAIAKFQEILERHGVTATVRRTLGSDINASCGQLRRKYEKAAGRNDHADLGPHRSRQHPQPKSGRLQHRGIRPRPGPHDRLRRYGRREIRQCGKLYGGRGVRRRSSPQPAPRAQRGACQADPARCAGACEQGRL